MADRLSVAVVAEIKEFERRFSMLPDVGAKNARELANQMRKEFRNAEEGASASASKIGKALGGIGDVVEKGLKKLGPLGGEVADVLFDFGAPLANAALGVGEVTSGMGAAGAAATVAGGAVIGIGAAVAAVALGAGLAVAGMVSLTEGAVAARDRLEEVGLASRIPPEAQEALDLYQGSTARLWQEVDVLTVQLGGALAPALTVLSDLLGDAIEWVNNLDKSFDSLRATITDVVEWLPEWARWGPGIDLVTGAVDDLEGAWTSVREASKGVEVGVTEHQVKEARRRGAEASASVKESVDDSTKYVTEGADEIIAYFKRDVPSAMFGLTRPFEQVSGELSKLGRKVRALTEEELAAIRDLTIGAANDIADGIQAITDMLIDGYEARIAAGEKVSEEEMRRANNYAKIGKAAAIVQLTLNAVMAWFQLTRDLGAIPGNAIGAPFEAAAIIGASMIAPAADLIGGGIPFPTEHSDRPGAPNVAPTSVGPAPGEDPNVRDDGYGSAPEVVGSGRDRSSRSLYRGGVYQGGGEEVAITIVFPGGRVGKRRVY